MKKMLKFRRKTETLSKEVHLKEKETSMKSITSSLPIKQKNNLVDVLNAEFHFVKYTAH